MADGHSEKASGAAVAKTGVRDVARAQFPERRASGGSFRVLPMIGAGAVAIALLTGASALTGLGGQEADSARGLAAQIAEREKRVTALDEERKQREEALAELQRRTNAKESEFAEASERVAALEERRGALQRQVAELTGPVTPRGGETTVVNDDPTAAPDNEAPQETPGSAEADAQSNSTASVDAPPRREPDPTRSRARIAAVPTPTPAPVAARASADEMADEVDRPAQAVGPVRVFIHVRSSDPAARNRARAVAAELRRRGVSVAEIRGVRLPVRRDSVRFFYDADRSAASELQRALRDASADGLNPVAQDYRSYGAPPRPGTIELWLS